MKAPPPTSLETGAAASQQQRTTYSAATPFLEPRGSGLRMELRYVDQKTFTRLLFFKQAVMDHSTSAYHQAVRYLLLEEEAKRRIGQC